MKKCNFCKIDRDISLFGKDSRGKDGLKTQCNLCKRVESKQYRIDNKEKITIYAAKYRKENKILCNKRVSKWSKENRAKRNATWSKYRANKLQATPNWLTEEINQEIKDIYQEVQDLRWLNEEALHVDHIIPLQGNGVCGLHIPSNLQILTASKNISKGNKLLPENNTQEG